MTKVHFFTPPDSDAAVAYRIAGQPDQGPALLLLHGFPSSSRTFRDVIQSLSRHAFIVAPDLPGHGESDVLPQASFEAFADVIEALLKHLGVRERIIYLHDFGAPVGLHLAMRRPNLTAGLIIQNANAHETGFGPQWAQTRAFWTAPNPENEAAATAHLTLIGTRDQYVAGVPGDVARRIDPAVWEEDWRVMGLPGRLDAQRELIADYANHVARFGAISNYMAEHQPPALLVWGRHDSFFDLAEVQSWMQDLPRMEAHILDGGHFLLETHAEKTSRLMGEFLQGLE